MPVVLRMLLNVVWDDVLIFQLSLTIAAWGDVSA